MKGLAILALIASLGFLLCLGLLVFFAQSG
jgi:hypothetical protein